jgi:branched-chain amino acid transport system permease protein
VNDLLSLLVLGLASAAIYAVAASGLVVTYTTSGIFNFAHGAVAMVSAFVYWQLSSPEAWGLPVPLALVLTLFVFAPGLGWGIDRLLMRRLHDASPMIRIVVPIGLLVALIQIATVIWPPGELTASVPLFFAGRSVELGGVVVEYHQLVVFAAAIGVAVGLRILLYGTRIGVAMRAVVDSRDLASLNGVAPDRVSGLAWALGCSLAALAGILVAPILKLDQTQLTLLVINAYAVAMVGRLRSLPMAAVGAVILGLSREAAGRYDESLPFWITKDTVPALMLFVVLLVVPQEKASVFRDQPDRSSVPDTRWRTVLLGSLALVAVAFVLPSVLDGGTLDAVGYGVALSIVGLSLVPLTGLAGQINLAPLAFAGIGAVVMYQWGSDGNPLALVAVVVVCAVVGALVALPALRLKGLYLALSTFAFALFCEKAIFPNVDEFSQGDAAYERLHLGPWTTASDRANLVLLAVVFALLGIGVTAVRRGSIGRRLQAMKDSPAACATMGLDLTALKLQVFALSAAIAGLGGALLGGWRGKVGTEQFSLLAGALPGLPLVLLTVVGGIAAVSGALLGGVALAMFPEIAEAVPALANLMTVLPGLAGISLAANRAHRGGGLGGRRRCGRPGRRDRPVVGAVPCRSLRPPRSRCASAVTWPSTA